MGCCGGKQQFKASVSDFDAIEPGKKSKKVYHMNSVPGWVSSDDRQNELKRGLSEDVMSAPGGKKGGKKKKPEKPKKNKKMSTCQRKHIVLCT